MNGLNRLISVLGLASFGLLVSSCVEEKKAEMVFVPDHSLPDTMLESKMIYDNLPLDAKLNIALAQANAEAPEIIDKVKTMKSPWLLIQYLKHNKAFQNATAKQGIDLDSVPASFQARIDYRSEKEILSDEVLAARCAPILTSDHLARRYGQS